MNESDNDTTKTYSFLAKHVYKLNDILNSYKRKRESLLDSSDDLVVAINTNMSIFSNDITTTSQYNHLDIDYVIAHVPSYRQIVVYSIANFNRYLQTAFQMSISEYNTNAKRIYDLYNACSSEIFNLLDSTNDSSIAVASAINIFDSYHDRMQIIYDSCINNRTIHSNTIRSLLIQFI